MTDREQDLAEVLAERERMLLEDFEEVTPPPVGEEFDPDALRVVPDVDEDGNIVDEVIADDPMPDE